MVSERPSDFGVPLDQFDQHYMAQTKEGPKLQQLQLVALHMSAVYLKNRLSAQEGATALTCQPRELGFLNLLLNNLDVFYYSLSV